MSIAYYNGEFQNYEDVRIPLCDRCVFFGDGVYEAVIGHRGQMYMLSEHIERFFRSAEALGLKVDFSRKELSIILGETVMRNGYTDFFLYFQLTRALKERSHAFGNSATSRLLVTVKEYSLPSADKEISLITGEDVRYSMCNVKTLNLIPNVLASEHAEACGCSEFVFLRDGAVTECAHSNIAIVKNGALITHPDGKYILPGITKGRIISLARESGIRVIEEPYGYDELLGADDVLVMSTSKLCVRAYKIDGILRKNPPSDVGNTLILALRDDYFRQTGQIC